jgi:hypothetical protein
MNTQSPGQRREVEPSKIEQDPPEAADPSRRPEVDDSDPTIKQIKQQMEDAERWVTD